MKKIDPTDTDWLGPDEQQQWNAFAYMLTQLPAAFETRMQQGAGISHFEYIVLSTLSTAPDRTLRISEVADYAGSSLTRLSNVVIRLESRGWIQRHPDPHDGRGKLATLTDHGYDTVVAAAPIHVAAVREFVFDPLTTAQRRNLAATSQRILDSLRAVDSADTSTA